MSLIGWLANILIVIGLWQIGNRKRTAFLFTITGELIWTIKAFVFEQYDLAFICAIFCILAVRNWIKWKSEKEQKS